MTYVKWNATRPSHKLSSFSNLLDNFIGDIERVVGNDTQYATPAANITETDNEFILALAVAGVQKEDIDIKIENHLLTISSKKKETTEADEQPKYNRKEFDYSNFKRSFSLSKKVDAGSIHAKYEAGVLSVHIPKKEEEKPQTRNIQIN